MTGRDPRQGQRQGQRWRRLVAKPLFWVLVFLLAWLTLIVVQITMGMGAAPDGRPR